MIIRRRHTANFTTIGNALFDDERLAADEVGILAFLLSRPHDWEVRRPALMRRWDIGPVSTKRIINNLMKTGWCQARKTRLANGTFHIIYEIRDQPGPTLSDDEIRAALSLVSNEVGNDESESGTQSGHPVASEHPPPCQPGVAYQGVVDSGVASKKESLNTDSQNPESTQFARVFAEVLQAWPSEHVLSTVTAEAAYIALNDTHRSECFDGMRPYLDDCKAQNRKVCDLTTFIRERRWERFVRPVATAKYWPITLRSPQWWRWREYKIATGQSVAMMDELARQNKGFTAPSEWPPAKPEASNEHNIKSGAR